MTDIPIIPGCTLGRMRACGGLDCDGCGWHKDEIARRKELIRRDGLTQDRNGTRRLVIKRRYA